MNKYQLVISFFFLTILAHSQAGLVDSTSLSPSVTDLLVNDQGYQFSGEYQDLSDWGYRYNALQNYLAFFPDPAGTYTVEQVIENWAPLDQPNGEIHFDRESVYWAGVSIIGSDRFHGLHLFSVGGTDGIAWAKIDIYSSDGEGGFDRQKTGSSIPLRKRFRRHYMNLFEVDIPRDDTLHLYFRLEKINLGFQYDNYYQPLIVNHIDRTAFWNLQPLFWLRKGIFIGSFFLFFLYYALYYIMERSPEYIYFSLIMLTVFIGLATEGVIKLAPTLVDWGPDLYQINSWLFSLFICLFLRIYLNLEELKITAGRFMFPILTIALVVNLVGMSFRHFRSPYLIWATMVGAIIGLFFTLLLIYLGVQSLRKGHRPAIFYLLSFFLFLVTTLIALVHDLTGASYLTYPKRILLGQITVLALPVLYALGMSYRSRILRRQKEAAALAEQTATAKALLQERHINEQLQKVDQLKDQFLANTSHELRTPLQGIIGLSEFWEEKTEDDRLREDMSMITSSGKRLSNLVNDILDFSKLKNYDVQLARHPVNLSVLTDIVLRNNAPLIKGKNMELINDIPSDLMAVNADENRLQQVLYNLIGNAIKFTEQGYIKLHAEEKDGWVQVSVEDTGIGIPPEKQEAIFQEFEQGDGSISREYTGTGLGLTISKRLIELHGGQMWVESPPVRRNHSEERTDPAPAVGQGSVFFFTLPISAQEATTLTPGITPRETTDPVIRSEKTQAPAALHAVGNNAIRILVVDDEPINQQVLQNHLSGKGFQLIRAMNGGEAISAIKHGPPFDLVLLDVMMPRMSGYEVCRKIREMYLPSELPVIMITAKNQLKDIVDGLSFGANDYLPKPFHREELLARIQTQLDLHRINSITSKFVPNEFLHFLGRDRITEVILGDQTEREVTVLFSDIRDYTTFSETMTPEENFRFVNAFHKRMGPVIQKYGGFINQYLGDAIMAIFPKCPEDALRAAIDMQQALDVYNKKRINSERQTIRMGIGLHTGSLIMGIIGDENRMDAATISDTVNTASRIESLTKHYGTSILLSEDSWTQMEDTSGFRLRYLGKVQVKGKKGPVGIYECFDGDAQAIASLKTQGLSDFEKGIELFLSQEFSQAAAAFAKVVEANAHDHPARLFINKSSEYLLSGVPDDWNGVEVMSFK